MFKSPGRTPEDRVKDYHKRHYEFIDKAIKADEAQDFENAIQFYIKGLEFSNMCLKENITGSNSSQVRCREIQEKIRKNRESELERLEYLCDTKVSNKLNPNKTNLKKSSSFEADKTDDSRHNFFHKSMREKKSKKTERNRKDSGQQDNRNNGMGGRSYSATCINKINNVPSGNLAKALNSLNQPPIKVESNTPTNFKVPGRINNSNNYNTNISATSPRQHRFGAANTTHSGPPKPKLSQSVSTEEPSTRVVDKNSIMSKLKNIDKQCVETILNEVLDSKVVKFEDVSGNDGAKQCLLETVIYPKLRPELFTGLRSPAKGVLLFGPPGNGKTLLAKAVANESRCVFFNISAASLMSKWVGEGEKMVRALFATARIVAPAVIFLDEVDSLLSARNSDDKSVTRRMLTQFLQEIDGAASEGDDKVLVMAATNRPDELDDAALRRFQKKIYIRMPDNTTRKLLLKSLLTKHSNKLKDSEVDKLVDLTKNYSSSDLTNLAKSAAMIPIRELSFDQICSVTADSMRHIKYTDFLQALKQIKPSVPVESLVRFDKWNNQYGDNS